MRLISTILFQLFSNTIALIITPILVNGFIFNGDFLELLKLGLILTLINLFVRPILKLIFGPLIVLTLGLFLIILNAFTIYLLDFFSENLIIEGYLPLLLSTLIISLINLVINYSAKIINRD